MVVNSVSTGDRGLYEISDVVRLFSLGVLLGPEANERQLKVPIARVASVVVR